MRQFLSKLTLLRLFSLVLGFLLLWIIISPIENHSLYHKEIIYGLFILIAIVFIIEYFLMRKIAIRHKLFTVELLILFTLFLLWYFEVV